MSVSDWRNVRVKEEPMSDYEDVRGGSRSRGYSVDQGRSSSRGGDRRDGRRDRRERHSPSPPPTHAGRSKKLSRFSRSRSRSPGGRDREGGRDRNRSSGRRDRSRSRDRGRESTSTFNRDDRDRRRPPSRERERDRGRPDGRHVKAEPRSRSSSPNRNFGGQDRRGGGEQHSRNEQRRDHRGQNNRERPRDGARQRDWDNFFNPNSEMSKEAVVKREKEERNRKEEIGEFGKKGDDSEAPKEKEQPNFGLSGKLTEEANTFRGVVIKYAEPPEARKPNKIRWRLYPFKGEEALPVMYVHRQSAYLLGRDRKVADIPVDHPSCSKQHAVLQYRLVPYTRPDGSKGRRIRPYIIDLESANGTFVNGKQIDPKRYVELFEKDVLKFGFSSREYVLLHDESKGIEDEGDLTPD